METNVINKSDIRKVIGKRNPLRGLASNILYHAMGFARINRDYRPISELKGIEFVRAAIERFKLKCTVSEDEINNIPAEGAAVIVSNHPFGGADGLLLYEAAHRVRSDVKVMTNFILSMIGPLSEDFLPVNPFRGAKWAPGSSSGMKQAIRHLENGGLLIIFPAGEVSTIPKKDFYKKLFSRRVMARDIPWENSSMKLIARSGCPVIPVYFHGQNSRLFHLAGHLFLSLLQLIQSPRHQLLFLCILFSNKFYGFSGKYSCSFRNHPGQFLMLALILGNCRRNLQLQVINKGSGYFFFGTQPRQFRFKPRQILLMLFKGKDKFFKHTTKTFRFFHPRLLPVAISKQDIHLLT